MSRERQDARRGFTFVELTIVVAMMGLFAGVALPRFFNSLSKQQVDAAARRLAFDINSTRRQAILTTQSTSVTLDVGANSYTLTGVSDPNRHALPNTVVSLNDGVMSAAFGTINLDGGGTSVSFNGFGFPNKGGTITLNSGSASKQVSLDTTTGLARVQ